VDPSIWERIGPAGEGDDIFLWEAVLRGEGLVDLGSSNSGKGWNGSEREGNGGWQRGYEGGKWLLEIKIPEAYPVKAPVVRFVTRICHPNVDFMVYIYPLSLFPHSTRLLSSQTNQRNRKRQVQSASPS